MIDMTRTVVRQQSLVRQTNAELGELVRPLPAETRFGEKVRELRKGRGITQEQLADAADVARTTVFDLEKGTGKSVRLGMAKKVLTALGLDEEQVRALLRLAQEERDAKKGLETGAAERIRRLRAEHGMSQEEFAEGVGVNRSIISLLETGMRLPSAFQLKRIADAFGLAGGAREEFVGQPMSALSALNRKVAETGLGRRLKELRIRSDVSQRELGGKVGWAQSGVSDFELGKRVPDKWQLYKIADALGLGGGETDELMRHGKWIDLFEVPNGDLIEMSARLAGAEGTGERGEVTKLLNRILFELRLRDLGLEHRKV